MFSKRNGYTEEKIIQIDSLDNETRRAIWNMFYMFTKGRNQISLERARRIACSEFGFNQTLEEFEYSNHSNRGNYYYSNDNAYNLDAFVLVLKERIENAEWNKVFDLIEFFTENSKFLIDSFNKIFEKNVVGSRFINGEICKITNESELAEISETKMLPNLSKIHFSNALNEFSKRKNANYKLVARESIDGLEALLRDILGDEKIILGKSINRIQADPKYTKYSLLFEGLDKIWAFANDQLRHAEKHEESIISFHDAKFILVLTSSIANYIESIR